MKIKNPFTKKKDYVKGKLKRKLGKALIELHYRHFSKEDDIHLKMLMNHLDLEEK